MLMAITMLTNAVVEPKDWTLHAHCQKIERELAIGSARAPQHASRRTCSQHE